MAKALTIVFSDFLKAKDLDKLFLTTCKAGEEAPDRGEDRIVSNEF